MALLILLSTIFFSLNASAYYEIKVIVEDGKGERVPGAYVKIRPWLNGYGGFTDSNGEFLTPDDYAGDEIVRIYANKLGYKKAYLKYNLFYHKPNQHTYEATLTLPQIKSRSVVRTPLSLFFNQFPTLQRLLNL